MADTISFGNSTIDGYYQSFLKTLPNEQITYEPVQYAEQTVEGITEQVEKYLRNYYDQSIAERQRATVQQNAALDVDAASRGMGSSTFLSDMKNRQYMAEAADISDMNSDYNATLAQTVQDQYNQYLTNKLNVDFNNQQIKYDIDKWNASSRLALEELAYERAHAAYELSKKSSGGGSSSGSSKKSGNSTTKKPTVVGETLVFVSDDGSKQYRRDYSDGTHDYYATKSAGWGIR